MEAFESLKKKAEEVKQKTGKKMLCNVLVDETSIRQHAQWNENAMKFDGFVDLGRNPIEQKSLPLAKDALVFMVCGVEEDFKIPVAYFLVSGLNADERAATANQIFLLLNGVGIDVVAITFDGLPANLSMVKSFGGDFAGKPYFPDPCDKDRKIYAILDAAHMIKLIRNSIASRNLVDGEGGVISWKYFVSLYEAQKNLSWNLNNKLTKAHIQWDKKKMSVKLAVETISNSVADSMEFLQQESEHFKDVGPTVKLIRVFNDVFDIMNSVDKEAEGFKRPITKATAPEHFRRLQEAMIYIKDLKVEGETGSIFASSVHTAFTGFYNNIISFMAMFDDYVQTNKITKIITHRFSQDLLESFFGSVRSMGGRIFLFFKIKFICMFFLNLRFFCFSRLQ